jgi:hypothetical protein
MFTTCLDVLFDKEAMRLMSASLDNSVRAWDPRAGPAEIARYTMSAPVRSLALNHEGDCLYFCPNPHDHDWIELRSSDRKVARARAAFWSTPVRHASKVALSPFRLATNTDYAVFGALRAQTYNFSQLLTMGGGRWLACVVAARGGERFQFSAHVLRRKTQRRLFFRRPEGGVLDQLPGHRYRYDAHRTCTRQRSGLVLIDVGGR